MRSRLKLNIGSVAYTYSLFAKGGVAENISAYSPGMDQSTPLSNGINLYLPIGGKHHLKSDQGIQILGVIANQHTLLHKADGRRKGGLQIIQLPLPNISGDSTESRNTLSTYNKTKGW